MKKIVISLIYLSLNTIALEGYSSTPASYNKVALAIAAPKGAGQSSFGHAYLRFSKDKWNESEDYIVEFVANARPEQLNRLTAFGLWGSYDIKVVEEKMSKISFLHREIENRDIVNYELELNQETITSLLNELLKQKSKKSSYNFIFNNCSSNVAEVLGLVLNIKINIFDKFVPVNLHKALEKNQLIKNKFIDKSFLNIRKNIVDSLYKLKFADQLYFYDFSFIDEQLKHESYLFRALGYLRLAEIYNQTQSNRHKENIKNFIYALIPYELREIRKDLFELFSDKSRDVRVSSLNVNSLVLHSNIEYEALIKDIASQSHFSNKKNEVFWNYKSKIIQNSNSSENEISISEKVNDLSFSDDNSAIMWDDLVVAYKAYSKASQKVVKRSGFHIINYYRQTETGSIQLIPYFVYEGNSNFVDLDKINSSDVIKYINGQAKTPGVCLALVHLQDKMWKNIKFSPDQKLEPIDVNIGRLKRVLNDESVVISGYANIADLTNDIGSENLFKILSDSNKHYNSLLELFALYFRRITVDSLTVKDLQNLIKLNKAVKIYFQPKGRSIEHSMLLIGITETQDYYKLKVYDPNIGLNSNINEVKYWISKSDFSLTTTLYKTDHQTKLDFEFD